MLHSIKIVLALIVVTFAVHGRLCAYSGRDIGTSIKYHSAVDAAQREIDALTLRANDMRHLAEYLEFFSAWYAPVTPAPIALIDKLPDAALAFVERIKGIAQRFVRRTLDDRRMLGMNRLTPEGRLFYKTVIDLVTAKNDQLS